MNRRSPPSAPRRRLCASPAGLIAINALLPDQQLRRGCHAALPTDTHARVGGEIAEEFTAMIASPGFAISANPRSPAMALGLLLKALPGSAARPTSRLAQGSGKTPVAGSPATSVPRSSAAAPQNQQKRGVKIIITHTHSL